MASGVSTTIGEVRMKIHELIERLHDFDDEMEVMVRDFGAGGIVSMDRIVYFDAGTVFPLGHIVLEVAEEEQDD